MATYVKQCATYGSSNPRFMFIRVGTRAGANVLSTWTTAENWRSIAEALRNLESLTWAYSAPFMELESSLQRHHTY
jgi:hypothetical protein